MTAETSNAEPTKAPAFRKPNQTRAGRLRQELIGAYTAALGGHVSPIVMEDIRRAADLVTLAAETRDAVRLGTAKVSDLVRLEGSADRAVRRLNLPPPGAAAPMGLHDHVARRALERANPQPAEGDD